jgi:hypothetical protein
MNKEKIIIWAKKLGWVGFFFFLIKGLVWLAVFYFGAKTIIP